MLSARLLEQSGDVIELAKTHCAIARYHLSTQNVRKAKAAVRDAFEILASINTLDLIPDDLTSLLDPIQPERNVLRDLAEIARRLTEGQEDGRALQQIVASVNRILGAERGAVLLLNQGVDPPELELRASKNFTVEHMRQDDFSSALEMMKGVITSGKGCISESTPTDGTSSPGTIRSSICVPLVVRRDVVGVLYHDNHLLANIFRESDIEMLSCFAALAAVVVERTRDRKGCQPAALGELPKEEVAGELNDDICEARSLVGNSLAMKTALSQIKMVAKTDTAVLILGETGVGKSMLAEVIHEQSQRRRGPFVQVQCSALTESLITSELFGHEKGAFTGAIGRKIGRFELAHGGTLFLDEIGDLPLEVQARLLRVLQTKEFERVGGGQETVTSDFRLIAATNKDLESEVRLNRFRQDLFYRINVVPVVVPPLRARKEDIPILAQHFLKQYSRKQGKKIDTIPSDAMKELMLHDWPGNVRELENAIQRGVIMSQARFLLLPELQNCKDVIAAKDSFPTLVENERNHILQALHKTKWKVHGPGGAAEMLGINPRTLDSRLKKLGVVRPKKTREA
jgi:transcriptional regulator with GAF, ATPase, and Fis domain